MYLKLGLFGDIITSFSFGVVSHQPSWSSSTLDGICNTLIDENLNDFSSISKRDERSAKSMDQIFLLCKNEYFLILVISYSFD